MQLGTIKCLPPCHVTYLASCHNWSLDLAQCQVPAMWLGTLPSYMTSLGTVPTSPTASPQPDSISLTSSTNAPSQGKLYSLSPLRQKGRNSWTNYIAGMTPNEGYILTYSGKCAVVILLIVGGSKCLILRHVTYMASYQYTDMTKEANGYEATKATNAPFKL